MNTNHLFKRIFFTIHPDGKIKAWKLRGLILLPLIPAIVCFIIMLLLSEGPFKSGTSKHSKQDEELIWAALYHQQQTQFILNQQRAATGN